MQKQDCNFSAAAAIRRKPPESSFVELRRRHELHLRPFVGATSGSRLGRALVARVAAEKALSQNGYGHNKKRYTLKLPITEHLTTGKEGNKPTDAVHTHRVDCERQLITQCTYPTRAR